MKTTIAKVLGKPSDYWICPACSSLNWYENEECCDKLGIGCEQINPMEDYSSKMADYEETLIQVKTDLVNEVLDYIKDEIEFYMEEYDYDEDDCDNIELTC